MSEVAAEGLNLPRHELEWLIARTPEEFSKKLAAVHEDESLNAKLSSVRIGLHSNKTSAPMLRSGRWRKRPPGKARRYSLGY
jgi:hypothetical protein